MTLTFLGAARTVTGSKHLLEVGGHRILVDCGLFQGLKDLRERNWQALPIRAADDRRRRPDARASRSLAATCRGWSGRASAAGSSARRRPPSSRGSCWRTPRASQEEDAERANRKGYTQARAGAAALHRAGRRPRDGAAAAGRLRPADAGGAGRRRPSSSTPATCSGPPTRACGRSGGQDDPLRRRPRPLRPAGAARSRRPSPEADVLLVESTYGDRAARGRRRWRAAGAHHQRDGRSAAARSSFPAFALGRVEELLYWIQRPRRTAARFPSFPVYVDSPMAAAVLAKYRKRAERARSRRSRQPAPQPRSHGRSDGLCAFCTARLKVVASIHGVASVQESTEPAIVISVERHGDRRPRAAPPDARAAGPAQHRAVRRAIRRPARAGRAAARRREVHAHPRRRTCRCARASRRSTRCRRTPTRTRSCAGSAASRGRRRSPASCTASRRRWTRSRRASSASWSGPCKTPRPSGEDGTLMNTHRICSNRSTTPRSCSTTRTASTALPLDQKILIWHLYQAALAGRDIYYDQRYRHALEMREMLEEILTHADRRSSAGRARRDPPLHEALLDQLRSAQQPDGAQVRAEVLAATAFRDAARTRRERAGATFPRATGRVARRPARSARRPVLRSGGRRVGDEQDAGRGPRHPRRPAPTTCTTA